MVLEIPLGIRRATLAIHAQRWVALRTLMLARGRSQMMPSHLRLNSVACRRICSSTPGCTSATDVTERCRCVHMRDAFVLKAAFAAHECYTTGCSILGHIDVYDAVMLAGQ